MRHDPAPLFVAALFAPLLLTACGSDDSAAVDAESPERTARKLLGRLHIVRVSHPHCP